MVQYVLETRKLNQEVNLKTMGEKSPERIYSRG